MTKTNNNYNHTKKARIDCRMTSREKSIITSKANASNMFKGEFMVHLAMNYEIELLPSKISEAASIELSRIGNNVNQLTRMSNLIKKRIENYNSSELADLISHQNDLILGITSELKQLRDVIQ